ncbi:MAG: ribosome biogenesis/translation initiation ATPase RLI [Halobacteriales archaeon]
MARDSIAVVDLERCQPDRCNYECVNFCPPNRTGKECIVTREERHGDDPHEGKPEQVSISEEICLGETCGICVEKCPFDAIQIVNLPHALADDPIHRFGENTFELYGLPVPEPGRVTGVLGPNGIGKTTAVHILAGELMPNRGAYDAEPAWEEVIEAVRGTELQGYLESVVDGDVVVSRKPQYVDRIPDRFEGTTAALLSSTDERGALDELVERLGLGPVLDQSIQDLSGGELQRVAVAAALSRDADVYFLDEVTPYLDVGQRMTVAQVVRDVASADRAMLVVEHDLAILDLLADVIHLGYGEPGAFGVITDPRSTRGGINAYLSGYLENENVRIRESPIAFERRAPGTAIAGETLATYPDFAFAYGDDGFRLSAEAGSIHRDEVLGIVGPNGIGKTTFARVLTGDLEPADGPLDLDVSIAYKPQYVEVDQPLTVETFLSTVTERFGTSGWETALARPLQLPRLYDRQLPDLSGGERQRVAIAACLSEEADLYLLDEPSAHLDVEQRVGATTAIRRFADRSDRTVMVIDHDIYMIDLLADRLLVFDGEPAERGHAGAPASMRDGMNRFLGNLGVTFRRDERSGRPRVNKPGSQLDREQRRAGEYYYEPAG